MVVITGTISGEVDGVAEVNVTIDVEVVAVDIDARFLQVVEDISFSKALHAF